MASVSKGHRTINAGAEVIVRSPNIDFSANTYTNQTNFEFAAVDGQSYIIKRIGCTATVDGGTAHSGVINVGILTDPDKFIDEAKVDRTIDKGQTVATDKSSGPGGASLQVSTYEWEFAAAGISSDGLVRLGKGEILTFDVAQEATATGEGVIFVVLIPENLNTDLNNN